MRSRGMGPSTATLRLADTTTLQTSRPGTGRSAARGLGKALAASGTGPDTCTRRGPVPFGALYAGMALQSILGVAEHMGLEPLITEGAARVKPLLQAREVAMPLVERGDRRRVHVKKRAATCSTPARPSSGTSRRAGDPSPFDRIQATRLTARCIDFLSDQLESGTRASAMIGFQSGRLQFTDLTSYPTLVEQGVQRPVEQRWMAQRPLAQIMTV
jgi:hypothetical protein